MTELQQRVLDEARSWLGTPWMEGGSCAKGPQGGVDCSRFVLAVFRNCGIIDETDLAIVPGNYCIQLGNKSLILAWMAAHSAFWLPVEGDLMPCDVMTFWEGAVVHHMGIVLEDQATMISARIPFGVHEFTFKGDRRWEKAFYKAFRPKALWE